MYRLIPTLLCMSLVPMAIAITIQTAIWEYDASLCSEAIRLAKEILK